MPTTLPMYSSCYDVVIVGAGVAGSSLAHALATLPRTNPLRIALLERSLSEPDRIVGELLQPGGLVALHQLDMSSCVENIDAITVKGYLVVENGQSVQIPYPPGNEGRSFHHGRFIMALRERARQNANVDVIEATVSKLLQCQYTGRVIGVRGSRKNRIDGLACDAFSVFGSLVVVADGCFSNFRGSVLGDRPPPVKTKSYFVGAILKNAVLPLANHGTVVLAEGHQPILLYQISKDDIRMLIDMQLPLPADIRHHILHKIIPTLPESLHEPVYNAFSQDRIRRMPNSFLPPIRQGGTSTKAGAILLGDSWNMRHPLTGGGMTVALSDVVILRNILGSLSSFEDWDEVSDALLRWHWGRKPLSSTINLLSGTLYGLFGEHSDPFLALRKGCFKYFQLGGRCISGPVALLAGLAPSPLLLITHFFSVIFYSIWVVFTHPPGVKIAPAPMGRDFELALPEYQHYLYLLFKAFRMFWAACSVFVPILWSEIGWWAPLAH